jgi:hypothetical protein
MSMPMLAPSLTVTSPGTTTRPDLARHRVQFASKSNVQGERVHRTSKPYAGRPERRRVDANGMPIDNAGPPPRSGRPGPTSAQLKRLPAGTPPILKGDAAQRMKEKKASQSKLSEMLRSEEMKQWLRSRLVTPGSLNMGVSQVIQGKAVADLQALQNDPWLKQHGILPPGHRDAPETSGAVFWKLIDNVLQEVCDAFDSVYTKMLMISLPNHPSTTCHSQTTTSAHYTNYLDYLPHYPTSEPSTSAAIPFKLSRC